MGSLHGKRIVIAGGSGFLGMSMARYFVNEGANVIILSRSPPKVHSDWRWVNWGGRSLGEWKDALRSADAVVNLAGRSVNCIKTPDHQDEILRSRIESTSALGQAMRSIDQAPPVWVQMSTAHIYGDPPSAVCDEDSATGIGLAPTVGREWEQAFAASKLDNQRGVVMRTSFVIGRNRGAGGGAMSTLGWLARLGLGGTVGSGSQGMSWIHETDLNRLFDKAITDENMSGVYVASAPNPVSQAEFMRTLRRTVRMPIGLPSPEWLVRIAAPLLLRTDPELVIYGRYVVSKRLADAGFDFEYPDLVSALSEVDSN
ncbi:MAG: TIGR01777 family oxidoreductase [Planctomycetales bacterium]|nr:TIGR01777 family oxidoreductase [Planctomycetales bacterium]